MTTTPPPKNTSKRKRVRVRLTNRAPGFYSEERSFVLPEEERILQAVYADAMAHGDEFLILSVESLSATPERGELEYVQEEEEPENPAADLH